MIQSKVLKVFTVGYQKFLFFFWVLFFYVLLPNRKDDAF